MPEIVLTMGQDGKPTGLTDDDTKAFALFRRRVKAMQQGDIIGFSWTAARSPKVQGAYFKALHLVFQNQERFDSFNEFREWAERGARHIEVFAACGFEFERVKSIRHEELDDDEFRLLFDRVTAFLLSARSLTHLWPHAKTVDLYAGAKAMLEGGNR